MDAAQVKAWEARCTEEQPPACRAACPLRVDARAMGEAITAGDLAGAFAIYTTVVPFPAILSRVCDHPCETACRRAEAGGAVRIRALERACVEEAYGTRRPTVRKAYKAKRIAIVGAGLAGLTAAYDLATKGHTVTVHEADAQALETLRHDHDEATLPHAVLDAEIAGLLALGVTLRCRSRIAAGDGPFGLETLIAENDAVLLSIGPGPAKAFAGALALGPSGHLVVDAETRATGRPKVFVSGLHDGGDESRSAIAAMSDGRRAAASIERFLQGASLTAARDDTAGTCLYVNVEAQAPRPPVVASLPDGVYTRAEAVAEAARCFPCRCLECVKACAYLARYGGYPKRYVREIYNNDSIVMGNRKANRMIDSCTLCGLCETLCPNDLAMGDVCLEARRSMVRRGKMPPSHHDFALRDMAFARSAEVTLARHQPGHAESAVAFFPGCQLAGSSPDHVARVYSQLCDHLPGGVGLMLDCCGAPAHWAGRETLEAEVRDGLVATWERLGRPELITACATCLVRLCEVHPEMRVRSLWPLLAELGWPEGPRVASGRPLAIHDPCPARHDVVAQRAVRDLAARLGLAVHELGGAEHTTCCGFGGLVTFANREVADAIVDRRIGESDDDYLVWCAMCRDSFARRGKRAVHLLDLAFPPPDGDADPAARPDPGFSGRRDNRRRLRIRLARELWGEEPAATTDDPAHACVLIIAPAVRADMERKLILEEDVARVVAQAEASGAKLKDRTTGRTVASARLGSLTCWVEYDVVPAGVVVHRAYGHRMTVEAKS